MKNPKNTVSIAKCNFGPCQAKATRLVSENARSRLECFGLTQNRQITHRSGLLL